MSKFSLNMFEKPLVNLVKTGPLSQNSVERLLP